MTNIDTVGVPEFFATEIGLIEDAGGGNIRVVRCVRRRGVLFPVYSLITPAIKMMTQAPAAEKFAVELHNLGRANGNH